jgi:uncharacterized DUF497 family protein
MLLDKFVFDVEKSATNLVKHGIDFQQAQGIWGDENRIEIKARSGFEDRWVATGLIEGKHWSAIFTYRAKMIRIISVRRARREEILRYETPKDDI